MPWTVSQGGSEEKELARRSGRPQSSHGGAGTGLGGNRIAGNTLTGGQHGQLAICYDPDGLGTPAAPSGDLVCNNLISRFNLGIQTSTGTAGNIFKENAIAYVQQGINELAPGSNVFEDNASTAIVL